MIKKLPHISSYYWISQNGTNAVGGVAILVRETLKTKVIDRQSNFLLIELDLLPKPILMGAIYVPPGKPFPHDLFEKTLDKPFYIFGDYNAKHTDWSCPKNNSSGSQLKNWLEDTSCEMIYPSQPTSKRSTAVIDFGLTYDSCGWEAVRLNEGSSDHYPVLFKAPLTAGTNSYFRKTNWKTFTYFLKCVFPYFNAMVYNLEPNAFLELFSSFLSSTWDRTSEYLPIKKYRPPWPPHLVQLARQQNIARRRYRRSKNEENLTNYLHFKNLYHEEKYLFLQKKWKINLPTSQQEIIFGNMFTQPFILTHRHSKDLQLQMAS